MRIFLLSVFFGLMGEACFCQLYTVGGGVTDVEGNSYQTIIINGQEWMSQNLTTSTYADGSQILNLTDSVSWVNTTEGAWAHYNNDPQMEIPFGKLYNWYTVADQRNVCPNGWHVPSDIEWKQLLNFLDPNANGGLATNTAGGLMKSTGTVEAGTGYWNQPNTGATNESGFSALPGGQRNDDHPFNFMGSFAYFWSSDVIGQSNAIFYILFAMNANALRSNFSKSFGMSVRCIKDLSNDINEIPQVQRCVVRIIDLLGRECTEQAGVPLIFIYDDGSRERIFIVD
jgi:uncharacterized protein (TIGR02145 family)